MWRTCSILRALSRDLRRVHAIASTTGSRPSIGWRATRRVHRSGGPRRPQAVQGGAGAGADGSSPLGDEFDRFNATVRDAADVLAPIRDAQALLPRWTTCAPSAPRTRPISSGCAAIQAAAAEQASHDIHSGDVRIEHARELLVDACESVERWDLPDGFEAIGPGLARSYRRGRRSCARAIDDRRAVHEWRKSVKNLWYQTRLLEAAAPSTLAPAIEALDKLGEALGDDHDLAVLVERLAADPHRYGGALHTLKAIEIARAQQAVLRQPASGSAPRSTPRSRRPSWLGSRRTGRPPSAKAPSSRPAVSPSPRRRRKSGRRRVARRRHAPSRSCRRRHQATTASTPSASTKLLTPRGIRRSRRLTDRKSGDGQRRLTYARPRGHGDRCPDASGQGLPVRDRRRDRPLPGFRDLGGPCNDAEAFAAWLRDPLAVTSPPPTSGSWSGATDRCPPARPRQARHRHRAGRAGQDRPRRGAPCRLYLYLRRDGWRRDSARRRC